MTLEGVLGRLEGVRRNGVGWMALCPAHADKNPSLSVKEENGRILIHCFAGCASDIVLSQIGMKISDLGIVEQVVAVYDYTDEGGHSLFQVVRYHPKSFKQRKPDGRGGWTWNLNGVRRVVYRLSEVLHSGSVMIVEGEKDVETARSRGFIATCNSGGAGKWRPEYSESLRGKDVVIVPDQDEPGRKHAEQVARALHLIATRVQMFNLPEPLKDLSEWPAELSTEALQELIDGAPEYKPDTDQQGGIRLTSLKDLLNEPEEEISWLLEDKLPAGGLSVLCAKPKVGKSTWARGLCLAVARGEPFMGCKSKKGPVIYLALEEKRSEVARHFRDLGATGEEDVDIHIHAASAPQDAVSELCRLTKQFRPTLIVIDPLFKFVRIRDEKAYAEVCNAIEPLLVLARGSGAHVLLVHHSGKMERDDATDGILGSTAIFGGVDSAIILRKMERYGTIQSCQRYGKDWPQTVLDFNPDERSISLGAERSEAEAEHVGEAIVSYLAGGAGPRTEPEIHASVEGMNATKRKALRALVGKGLLVRDGSGKKGDPFTYKCSYAPTFVGGLVGPSHMRTSVRELQNAADGSDA
jgi:AAA domain/CHC2 zinc finger